jgi:hypothetical protein
MRKSVFFLVLFLFGFFLVPPTNSFAQVIMKKPLSLPQQNQATIANFIPRAVTLQPGGPAEVVAVDGQYLETVLSMQAVRGGQSVGEITVKLVQPWPASRKIELQATANAPAAPGYQLRVIGRAGLNPFRIDVPLALFSLEVAGKKLQQMPQTFHGLEAGNVTPKVKGFLEFIMTVHSLADARAEFARSNFSPGEISQIRSELESSQALRPKIREFAAQYEADFLKRIEVLRKRSDAKAAAAKARWVSGQNAALTKAVRFKDVRKGIQNPAECTSDVPVITNIEAVPLTPGQEFCINGKGLGTGPGAVDLTTGGKTFMVHVDEGGWSQCRVCGHLDPDEAVGVRANPTAMISLRTNTGRETRHEVNFQPTLVMISGYLFSFHPEPSDHDRDWALNAAGSLGPDTLTTVVISYLTLCGGCCPGNSKDWTEFNFILKNDYSIYFCDFESSSDSDHPEDAHAEITAAAPLNAPNCSAQTSVHAGTRACFKISWSLNLYIIGPKGLPFK